MGKKIKDILEQPGAVSVIITSSTSPNVIISVIGARCDHNVSFFGNCPLSLDVSSINDICRGRSFPVNVIGRLHHGKRGGCVTDLISKAASKTLQLAN